MNPSDPKPGEAAADPRTLGPAHRLDGDQETPLMVARPEAGMPVALATGLAAVLGVGLFLALHHPAHQPATPLLRAAGPPVVAPAAPPIADIELPPEPAAPPAPPPAPPPQALPPPQRAFIALPPATFEEPRPSASLASRPNSPALVVDLGPSGGAATETAGRAGAGNPPQGAAANEANTLEQLAFAGGADGLAGKASAIALRHPARVVVQGAMIPAVLETAIDSDLPGFARAIVSSDIFSFDGSGLLIPRGSRVIGRYKSDLTPGQARVFIVWTRVIRPDGASIQIESPVTDGLGRNGLAGRVDRRLFDRYGGSALLSLISGGLNALSNSRSSQVIIGSPVTVAPATGAEKAISPVVRVPQGSRIRIFVARDLDFTNVGAAPSGDAHG